MNAASFIVAYISYFFSNNFRRKIVMRKRIDLFVFSIFSLVLF